MDTMINMLPIRNPNGPTMTGAEFWTDLLCSLIREPGIWRPETCREWIMDSINGTQWIEGVN